MLIKVCQICDAVQKLKEYGHMKYLAHEMPPLACSDFVNDLASLDDKIEELELQLSNWIRYVWRCRYHYSELNFYKTSQLIVLREELTKFENNDDHEISLHVFHLLNSAIGKPLESALVVKKALKGEIHDDDKNTNQKQELTVTETASEQTQPTDLEDKPEVLSRISQALAQIRSSDSMSEVYNEAIKLGYEDYLILQALLHEDITDIYEVIEWFDELEDENCHKYQKEWMVNEAETKKNSTKESTSDLLIPSTDASVGSVDDIDVSHIASYFFKGVDRCKLEKYLSYHAICMECIFCILGQLVLQMKLALFH